MTEISSNCFCLDSHLHGSGVVAYSLSPSGRLIVSSGHSRVIHIIELTNGLRPHPSLKAPSVHRRRVHESNSNQLGSGQSQKKQRVSTKGQVSHQMKGQGEKGQRSHSKKHEKAEEDRGSGDKQSSKTEVRKEEQRKLNIYDQIIPKTKALVKEIKWKRSQVSSSMIGRQSLGRMFLDKGAHQRKLEVSSEEMFAVVFQQSSSVIIYHVRKKSYRVISMQNKFASLQKVETVEFLHNWLLIFSSVGEGGRDGGGERKAKNSQQVQCTVIAKIDLVALEFKDESNRNKSKTSPGSSSHSKSRFKGLKQFKARNQVQQEGVETDPDLIVEIGSVSGQVLSTTTAVVSPENAKTTGAASTAELCVHEFDIQPFDYEAQVHGAPKKTQVMSNARAERRTLRQRSRSSSMSTEISHLGKKEKREKRDKHLDNLVKKAKRKVVEYPLDRPLLTCTLWDQNASSFTLLTFGCFVDETQNDFMIRLVNYSRLKSIKTVDEENNPVALKLKRMKDLKFCHLNNRLCSFLGMSGTPSGSSESADNRVFLFLYRLDCAENSTAAFELDVKEDEILDYQWKHTHDNKLAIVVMTSAGRLIMFEVLLEKELIELKVWKEVFLDASNAKPSASMTPVATKQTFDLIAISAQITSDSLQTLPSLVFLVNKKLYKMAFSISKYEQLQQLQSVISETLDSDQVEKDNVSTDELLLLKELAKNTSLTPIFLAHLGDTLTSSAVAEVSTKTDIFTAASKKGSLFLYFMTELEASAYGENNISLLDLLLYGSVSVMGFFHSYLLSVLFFSVAISMYFGAPIDFLFNSLLLSKYYF